MTRAEFDYQLDLLVERKIISNKDYSDMKLAIRNYILPKETITRIETNLSTLIAKRECPDMILTNFRTLLNESNKPAEIKKINERAQQHKKDGEEEEVFIAKVANNVKKNKREFFTRMYLYITIALSIVGLMVLMKYMPSKDNPWGGLSFGVMTLGLETVRSIYIIFMISTGISLVFAILGLIMHIKRMAYIQIVNVSLFALITVGITLAYVNPKSIIYCIALVLLIGALVLGILGASLKGCTSRMVCTLISVTCIIVSFVLLAVTRYDGELILQSPYNEIYLMIAVCNLALAYPFICEKSLNR